ncbi:MAG TPA: LPS export ABC transporter periplasmic protein LptC [Terriglobales bacterium]
MPPSISHLRRWFAGAAIAAILIVASMYFYARHRAQSVLQQIPEKIGVNVQQTATGFSVSKSEQGRTIFKIEASKAVQFKQGSVVDLHNVAITLFGRDSSRYDRIYGDEFEFNQQTGIITAKGAVQIDLEANPQGIVSPDQSVPQDLKHPIHLQTSGLVFNQKTGDAYTKERVDYNLTQASGSAVGVRYLASGNALILESQVALQVENTTKVIASHATITGTPKVIVLDHPHATNGERQFDSDQATLYLREDNTISNTVATGNVRLQNSGQPDAQAFSDQLDLVLASKSNALQIATLTGNVRMETGGLQPMQGWAQQITLHFTGNQVLSTVKAEENVRLIQHQVSTEQSTSKQDMELTASAVDFTLANGRQLDHAETSGRAQIAIRPIPATNGQETLITAAKFTAHFGQDGQLSTLHGAPEAKIVSKNSAQPDRVSTSDTLDAAFQPGAGIQSIVQEGHFAYADGETRAWAEQAHYTPADQILTLTGSPRVIDQGMTTTARKMRMNRATGDAFADGDVKSTYSDLKSKPNGALLASSSPIHVTARSMTAHGNSHIALYSGNVHLWQDANAVDAPYVEFDRNRRSVIATGTPEQRISTVLIQAQTDSHGNSTPVAITSLRLNYQDSERCAHFEGGVVAKSTDLTITAAQMDAYMEPRGTGAASDQASKLDKILATGEVVITQPNRHATGDRLVYTSAEDKFVLTGGPPSIFDAEHGKITGVSLTLFRHDDRVLVEGSDSSPTITQTRVAR